MLVLFMNRKKTPVPTGASDIMVALVALLLAWELLSTKLGIAHSVLVPSPENVFWVFVRNGSTLFECAISSLELLLGGYLLGMFFWRCAGNNLWLGAPSARDVLPHC